MKSTNAPRSGLLQKFSRLLPCATVEDLAVRSGFMKRKARKLTPMRFVVSFFLCCSTHLYSLSGWASQLVTLCGLTLSKQGLDSRLGKQARCFACSLLASLMKAQLPLDRQCRAVVGQFTRILLQDSTTFTLKDSLGKAFKGSVAGGVKKAVLRLKVIWEVCRTEVRQFSVTSFSHNDQSQASNVHAHLCKGALVIRDLGYWSIDSLEKIAAKGAFFLTRLRYNVSLWKTDGSPLALEALLKGRVTDQWVVVSKEHLRVRLVILPVAPAIAEQRVRRALHDRDKRLNHRADYYQQLRYNIFITNVEEPMCSPRELQALYGQRWQIEVLFKALKSGGLHLTEMLSQVCTNAERIRTEVALALCFLLLTLTYVYQSVPPSCDAPPVSLLKLLRWTLANLCLLFCLSKDQLQQVICYYCSYEKRKRQSLSQKLLALT